MRFSLTGTGSRTGKTILVVDDDPDLRLGLEIRLKANGYSVVVATDGEEGIQAATQSLPDLIVLDLGLPAGDGYTVMERLGESAATQMIPVIVLSAREQRPNRDRSLQAGAYTFLQKPAEPAELLGAIRRALGQVKEKPTRAEKQLLIQESRSRLLSRIVA